MARRLNPLVYFTLTMNSLYLANSSLYFNPRTREGCDIVRTIVTNVSFRFQSTHPWRVRHNQANRYKILDIISIHAPVKGATHDGLIGPHRHHRFQSTHPWRVRLGFHPYILKWFRDFNPRTREGCDLTIRWVRSSAFISIHAPVKGATRRRCITCKW